MPSDTEVVFWGIDASRPAEPSGMVNVTIDNTFSQSTDGNVKLEFAGGWQDVRAGSETDLSEKDSLDDFYNETLAVSTQKGSSVGFTGSGKIDILSRSLTRPDEQALRYTSTVMLDQTMAQPPSRSTTKWQSHPSTSL